MVRSGEAVTATVDEGLVAPPEVLNVRQRRIPWDRVWLPAVIIGVAVIAAGIRFYKLDDRSLWLDEIFTSEAAFLSTPGQVIAFTQADIDQVPLFYMFTWLLGRWGDSAFLLRLPSAAAGTLMVLAVYLLGRRLFGVRFGLVAAAVATVMPYAVWYSQEARNYALFMLLTTMQMYFAFGAVKRGRVLDWFGLACFTVLNLYTHYLALSVTAAVAMFVGLFALGSVLGRAPNQVKAIAMAAVVLIATGASLIPWRRWSRSTYVEVTSLASQHPRLSLAAGVVALVVGAAGLLILEKSSLKRRNANAVRQLELAVGAVVLVVAAYVPWLPSLRVFLAAPNEGLGRLNVGESLSWERLLGIPGGLGWSGLLLAVLGIGLVSLAIWVFRGRSVESFLLLCWLVVPLALLGLSARWAIVDLNNRYFAFLFPAATLVTAAGVDGVFQGLRYVIQRFGRAWRNGRMAPPAVVVGIVALMLVQILPALATSYDSPKDDWRATAAHIINSDPPTSVVLSVGNYYDWGVLSLGYYLRQSNSSIRVMDGQQITSDVVDMLRNSSGTTWGLLDHPSAAQLQLIRESTDVKLDFVDATRTIYLVRSSADGLSAFEQARLLLHWEIPQEPTLSAPAAMLDVSAGQGRLGPNLVPEVASALVLTGTQAALHADARIELLDLKPGDDFLVAFDHRVGDLNGRQVVIAAALDGAGNQLAAFPTGGGYTCGNSASWVHSYFAFRVPDKTGRLELVFRAIGRGTAEFRSIELRRITGSQ